MELEAKTTYDANINLRKFFQKVFAAGLSEIEKFQADFLRGRRRSRKSAVQINWVGKRETTLFMSFALTEHWVNWAFWWKVFTFLICFLWKKLKLSKLFVAFVQTFDQGFMTSSLTPLRVWLESRILQLFFWVLFYEA